MGALREHGVCQVTLDPGFGVMYHTWAISDSAESLDTHISVTRGPFVSPSGMCTSGTWIWFVLYSAALAQERPNNWGIINPYFLCYVTPSFLLLSLSGPPNLRSPQTNRQKNLLAFCGRTTTAAWQLAPRKQKKEQQRDQLGDFQLAFVVHIALSFACGELQVASPQKAPA